MPCGVAKGRSGAGAARARTSESLAAYAQDLLAQGALPQALALGLQVPRSDPRGAAATRFLYQVWILG